MQSKNKIIIAAAGSGKTTYLVKETIDKSDKKVLIVTFTNKNKEEILKKFIELQGFVPSNVEVRTWYSFLLSDCIRPYQKNVYPENRIEGVFFRKKPASRYINKSNVKGYYLNKDYQIDKDRISDFAVQCFMKNEDRVLNRLEEIYDYIFIDEVQDMSGFDLDIFKLFFQSKIKMVLVGDIRQATFATSNSSKHKKYRGINIIDYFRELEKKSICKIDENLNHSYRCNQSICDFADELFPSLESTTSKNKVKTAHDGLFIVKSKDVKIYRDRYYPQALRYNAKSKIKNAINFGESKGLTFDRVLIKPTKKIDQYLKSGEMNLDDTTLAKFYVAVTRARYSVAFISDLEEVAIDGVKVLHSDKF